MGVSPAGLARQGPPSSPGPPTLPGHDSGTAPYQAVPPVGTLGCLPHGLPPCRWRWGCHRGPFPRVSRHRPLPPGQAGSKGGDCPPSPRPPGPQEPTEPPSKPGGCRVLILLGTGRMMSLLSPPWGGRGHRREWGIRDAPRGHGDRAVPAPWDAGNVGTGGVPIPWADTGDAGTRAVRVPPPQPAVRDIWGQGCPRAPGYRGGHGDEGQPCHPRRGRGHGERNEGTHKGLDTGPGPPPLPGTERPNPFPSRPHPPRGHSPGRGRWSRCRCCPAGDDAIAAAAAPAPAA